MLKHCYSEVKKALSENKLAIFISIAILLISLLSGYFFKAYLYDYFNPVVNEINQNVQSGVTKFNFESIFSNNFLIISKMFVFGIFFCLSAVMLAFNGFFLGYYVAAHHSPYAAVVLMVPHGIFELPSCVLACTSGLVLFIFFFKVLKSFWNDNSFKDSILINLDKLKQSIIIYLLSIILMIVAGFVEVYLTIPIASFILG